MAAKKKVSFEAGMEQLEQLVSQLEKGEMPLDRSFAAYEQGVKLLGELRAQLEAGQARVMELTAQGEKPFTEDEAQ